MSVPEVVFYSICVLAGAAVFITMFVMAGRAAAAAAREEEPVREPAPEYVYKKTAYLDEDGRPLS